MLNFSLQKCSCCRLANITNVWLAAEPLFEAWTWAFDALRHLYVHTHIRFVDEFVVTENVVLRRTKAGDERLFRFQVFVGVSTQLVSLDVLPRAAWTRSRDIRRHQRSIKVVT